jgi:phage protein D
MANGKKISIIEDAKDGTYNFEYTTKQGENIVEAKVNGKAVKGFPFKFARKTDQEIKNDIAERELEAQMMADLQRQEEEEKKQNELKRQEEEKRSEDLKKKEEQKRKDTKKAETIRQEDFKKQDEKKTSTV